MGRPFDPDFATDALGDLAHELDLGFVVGPCPAGARHIGNPPGQATLFLGNDGCQGVAIDVVESPADVEMVLHEMAHARVGLEDEWGCFEREAVWALRFGPEVAAMVARLAWESGGRP